MDESTKKSILTFLANRPRGSTISEVSENIGISRPTVSKYLEILRAESKVEQREVGRAKLHYLKQESLENFTGAGTS